MPYKDPEQRREYQRRWIAARREEYLADKSCVICGSRDRMEIDHVDRAEKISHRIWSWSRSRLDAELAKCQALCHVHHLEKTVGEMSYPTDVPHGENTRYLYGCRCIPCCDAHTITKREWRAARRAAGLPVT